MAKRKAKAAPVPGDRVNRKLQQLSGAFKRLRAGPGEPRRTTLRLTDRELDAVIVGLRSWQHLRSGQARFLSEDGEDPPTRMALLEEIAGNSGKPLSDRAIDKLVTEYVNAGGEEEKPRKPLTGRSRHG